MKNKERIEFAIQALVGFATLENVKMKRKREVPQCTEHDPSGTWRCTRPEGHAGVHIAMRVESDYDEEAGNKLLIVWDPTEF